MKFLKGSGIDTDDAMLINVIYHKPTKHTDYTDYLDIVYKVISTGEKRLYTIENPEMEIYIVRDEYRDYDYNKAFIEVDKCYIKRVKCKSLENEIAKLAGSTYINYVHECRESKNFSSIKNVHKWRYVFGSDLEIENYFRVQWALEYENSKIKKVTKQFADIEVDSINVAGFPAAGSCPINAITLVDEELKSVFTFLLRCEKNLQIPKFEDNINNFISSLHDDFDESYGELKYFIYMYNEDDEIELIKNFFKLINTLKRDFLVFWNMSFDVPYIIARIKLLGFNPEDIMCSNDFKVKEAYYYADARVFDVKKKKDFVKVSSYTNITDDMELYVKLRAGKGELRSHALNTIAEKELGDEKLNYSAKNGGDISMINLEDIHPDIHPKITNTKSISIKTLPYANYDMFVRYNIKDVLLQYGIEKKTSDLDNLYARMCLNPTQPHKAFSQTVMLKSRAYIEYLRMGYIISNNINIDYGSIYEDDTSDNDEDDEKYNGAIVADPENNSDSGAIVMGKRSKYIRQYVVDYDATAMYPSLTIAFNISPASMVGKLIIPDKKIIDRYSSEEIINNKYDAGKEFVENLLTENYLMMGTRWFNLPPTHEIFKICEEYFKLNKTHYVSISKDYVNVYRPITENIEIGDCDD